MIWRACERFNILPPDVKVNFEDNDVWMQASIIAFGSIRDYEDMEIAAAGVKL